MLPHSVPSYIGITFEMVCRSHLVVLRAEYNNRDVSDRIGGIWIDGRGVPKAEIEKIARLVSADEEIDIRSLGKCGNKPHRLAEVEAELWSRLAYEPPKRMTFWISEKGEISEIERE